MCARPPRARLRAPAREGSLLASRASAKTRADLPRSQQSAHERPQFGARQTRLSCRPNMVSTWLTSGCGNAAACRHELVDRYWSLAPKRAGGSQRMGRFQKLAEQRARQWRREGITLGQEDTSLAQIFHLLEVFDTLGEDFHPHAARELDERFDDRG